MTSKPAALLLMAVPAADTTTTTLTAGEIYKNASKGVVHDHGDPDRRLHQPRQLGRAG